MQGSIKSRYGNEILDRIFCYFMRIILHLQNSGIEKLPLENTFEEPLKSFVDIAVDLLIDGQPPEIADLILNAEHDAILSSGRVSVKTAMCLRLVKELSWHIHYDVDYYGYLLSTENLWGNEVFEYASRTFYPNLPEEVKERYQIRDLIKYMPNEAYRRRSKRCLHSSTTKQKRGMSEHEAGTEHFNKKSLLYGREEDYGEGTDAPFRGLPTAEGIRIHQQLEQPVTWQFLRSWVY